MKRALDIIASATVLLALLPVLLLVMLLVRVRLGSPVFFTQQRPGLQGKPFKLIKFRTMLVSQSAETTDVSDQLRITPFGQRLRATSLDELPTLFNVLMGHMSLVGPRPLLMEYLPLYSDVQSRRHWVKPGVTGWAQINGRNAVSWERKFELDVWYVENQSFMLDVKILFKTFAKVLKREGITSENHVTSTKFKGTAHSTKAVVDDGAISSKEAN